MSGTRPLTYAVVTPVRNEAAHLRRLAGCLHAQTARAAAWVIVDTGSDDGTEAVAAGIAARLPGTTVIRSSGPPRSGEAVVVGAFKAGLATLGRPADVIVKLDADISFEDRYFETLLARFAREPELGIASGTCFERHNGRWRERHVTGDHVWGACRAYRFACLADVSPLEERTGWDGIDTFRARAKGWRTRTFRDLALHHHRPEGRRDGRFAGWRRRGRAAHYMGYRPSFLLLRALYQARRDPVALALLYGWARAAVRREPRIDDAAARVLLRREQRLRELFVRAREARGHRPARPRAAT